MSEKHSGETPKVTIEGEKELTVWQKREKVVSKLEQIKEDSTGGRGPRGIDEAIHMARGGNFVAAVEILRHAKSAEQKEMEKLQDQIKSKDYYIKELDNLIELIEKK